MFHFGYGTGMASSLLRLVRERFSSRRDTGPTPAPTADAAPR